MKTHEKIILLIAVVALFLVAVALDKSIKRISALETEIAEQKCEGGGGTLGESVDWDSGRTYLTSESTCDIVSREYKDSGGMWHFEYTHYYFNRELFEWETRARTTKEILRPRDTNTPKE